MEDNKVKNIVVLKNLPSNIVEEAIVVLKENKTKLPEYVETKNENANKSNSNYYVLKEAEMVISNYLSKIENKGGNEKKVTKAIQKKYKRLRLFTFLLFVALVINIFF